jgi:hypothetical protein
MANPHYSRAEGCVVEELPDGLLVARADGGQWLILRGTSVAVWEALAVPRTLDDLVAYLRSRYEGSAQRMADDITAALKEFDAAGVSARGD